MSTKKKHKGKKPSVEFARKPSFVPSIWETFASRPNPDGSERSHLIEDRYPLEVLFIYFEVIEWELIPFDPIEHRIPDHSPTAERIEGCDCVGCTGRPRLNHGWTR